MITDSVRRDLPSGTVTFLFTDVEGSTRLLHELGPTVYADVLDEHRRVVREACSSRGGVEVDTQGGAFFVCFPSAPGALEAAQAITERLCSGPIQVRIGLHTGRPLVTEEGYVGEDVHFAARVASSAHGGQVVLTQPTRALLDERHTIVDLGEHRLKDIPEPVPIHQLGAGQFPPLKTISNTNLPRPASSFVGRERELQELIARIDGGARLLTLTGPGGSGKTRLAIEVASTLVPSYKAGVFWAGLASVRDPGLVTETISQTLGAKDGLAEHIAEREMLVLLDNLEQVIEAAPELSALLTSCPNLSLLVTSRELLRVQGEVEYPVPPLAEAEAVSLFCERAQLPASAEVAELCRRLDNLPLAVELAAARAKALSPAQILGRLSQRLDLLKGGRDADARQQTLRATIEWSHELLSEDEQQLFRRLSVFAGGCTLEAAGEVADADLNTLQSLVEKSLLRFSNERYWMLETIREYAAERLAGSGELEASKQRHADFVLELASQLEAAGGADQKLRDRFVLEADNFRAALAWAEETGHTDSQLELLGRTWRFWWYRGRLTEGLRWVTAALARTEGERTKRRATALVAGGAFASWLGEVETVKTYAEQSLEIARTLGDTRNVAWSLILLGLSATELASYRDAANLSEEAIAVAREAGDQEQVGIAINNLGDIASRQRDYVRALPLFEEALAIARELGTLDDVAVYTYNVAVSLHHIGRFEEAAAAAKESLALAHEIDSLISLMDGFVLLASLASQKGYADAAARFLGAAEVLRERIGAELAGDEAALLETTVSDLMNVLGEDGYAEAVAEGRAMRVDEAVDDALRFMD